MHMQFTSYSYHVHSQIQAEVTLPFHSSLALYIFVGQGAIVGDGSEQRVL
jgi:hypothetical protein